MKAPDGSLRQMVAKWLDLAAAMPVSIVRGGVDGGSVGNRYVRIEAMRSEGRFSIVFFRHNDGVWRVFPSARSKIGANAIADEFKPCDT